MTIQVKGTGSAGAKRKSVALSSHARETVPIAPIANSEVWATAELVSALRSIAGKFGNDVELTDATSYYGKYYSFPVSGGLCVEFRDRKGENAIKFKMTASVGSKSGVINLNELELVNVSRHFPRRARD
jgi:hypothetical protein